MHFVNRQVGVVSESAKSEDPGLRRRRHGTALYSIFLFYLALFSAAYTSRVRLSVGGVDPVHSRRAADEPPAAGRCSSSGNRK